MQAHKKSGKINADDKTAFHHPRLEGLEHLSISVNRPFLKAANGRPLSANRTLLGDASPGWPVMPQQCSRGQCLGEPLLPRHGLGQAELRSSNTLLEQTKPLVPVPERWAPIAPTPVSTIEIALSILCDGFPGFGHFAGAKTQIFFHVATDATSNSIEIANLWAPRPKNGKKRRPRSPHQGRPFSP